MGLPQKEPLLLCRSQLKRPFYMCNQTCTEHKLAHKISSN